MSIVPVFIANPLQNLSVLWNHICQTPCLSFHLFAVFLKIGWIVFSQVSNIPNWKCNFFWTILFHFAWKVPKFLWYVIFLLKSCAWQHWCYQVTTQNIVRQSKIVKLVDPNFFRTNSLWHAKFHPRKEDNEFPIFDECN